MHVGDSPVSPPETASRWPFLPQQEIQDLAGGPLDDQLAVLASAIVAQPIRLHHECDVLRSGRVLESLKRIRPLGEDIRQRALQFVSAWCKSGLGQPELAWFDDAQRLSGDGLVFDNKSGAVSFDSYEWETRLKRIDREPWRSVVRYFEGTLGDKWQTDRPNFARRLETPTRTILRGDEYYINMANLPPLERIRHIATSFGDLLTKVRLSEVLGPWREIDEWKLALAVCDQLRNQALQLNWFAHRLARYARLHAPSEPGTNPLIRTVAALTPVVRRLTNAALGLYYKTLLLDRPRALIHVRALHDQRPELKKLVTACVEAIRKSRGTAGDFGFTSDFVRRWREADHPGENLLTAAAAVDYCRKQGVKRPVAVGIGWGGIELPLAFRHAWEAAGGDAGDVRPLVTHYSHYRGNEDVSELTYDPLADDGLETPQPNEHVVVFDDNILTGMTIERVQDDLLRRLCVVTGFFVTRISGGRRYGQMRMKQHGVLNPELVNRGVYGFLGETPFALTWSQKYREYENPIGVFSLPRRRIIELLHANTSADRYDREGF